MQTQSKINNSVGTIGCSNINPQAPFPKCADTSNASVKMAMVDKRTGEVLEVVTELSPGEEKQRSELMARMKAFAAKYMKSHPNTKPDRLKRIVMKKFNVKLT